MTMPVQTTYQRMPSSASLPALAPKDPSQRTAIVDMLRGWALLSVVLVNYAIFYSYDAVIRVPAYDVISRALKIVISVVFVSKGWTLLSLLFGYGFSALMEKRRGGDPQPRWLFWKRMFWLFVIAIMNSGIYYGDVLKDYVLMGLLISLFDRASKKTFLTMAIICLLAFPALIPISRSLHVRMPAINPSLSLYTSHNPVDVLRFGLESGLHVLLSFPKYFDWNLVMLTCGFVGAYLQKSAFFERLKEDTRLLKRSFWCSALAVIALPLIHWGSDALRWNVDRLYDAYTWFELSLMVFFASGLCWIFLRSKANFFFVSLQYVGRMTLTNYLSQNLVAMLLFSGFGLGLLHKTSYSFNIGTALSVFIVQVFFSRWWLSLHKWGPCEWLWRSLTYGSWISNEIPTAWNVQK
jgi:uncharacterized protein